MAETESGQLLRGHVRTYQNPSRGGLTRNQLARPVLGFRHESPFELLFALPSSLLLFLLRVIGREFWLFATTQKRERSPQQYYQQTREKREYAGQQKTPPLANLEAVIIRGGYRRRLATRHPDALQPTFTSVHRHE